LANYDAIIVGSGIVGSFAAFHLAKAGCRLLVADRNGLAAGTSRASDGNLLISDKGPGLLFDLTRDSLLLWHEAIAELGNECEFDVKGSTLVTLDPTQVAALRDHAEAHAALGIRAEFHADGFARFEPDLAPDVCAVGWWHDDAQVQPMLACYSIARHLQRRGVAYRLYDELIGWQTCASGVEVRFGSGETASAGHLILCTGVWTAGLLAPHGLSLPVIPRKGQICVLERGGVTVRSKIADFAYNSTVEDADPSRPDVQTAAIIEMTRSGTLLCGSSRQFAGFDTSLDRATLAQIMRDCTRVVPGLAGLRIIRGYAGLRPYCRDGLPAIGPVDEHERLYVATGHEGTGHGLAPVTGAIVAGLLSGAGHVEAAAVDPRRLLS
jgi:glycine/D-amino acid oxidase-like deaminating enzyme